MREMSGGVVVAAEETVTVEKESGAEAITEETKWGGAGDEKGERPK